MRAGRDHVPNVGEPLAVTAQAERDAAALMVAEPLPSTEAVRIQQPTRRLEAELRIELEHGLILAATGGTLLIARRRNNPPNRTNVRTAN